MSRVIKNDDQTLCDMAVQHCGDMELFIEELWRSDVSITNETENDIVVNGPTKRKVVEVLNMQSNIVATAPAEKMQDGIEHWRIGLDFKIS